MVHVAVAVEEVPLQGGPGMLLRVPVHPRLVLVVPVAVVPRAAVGLPGAEAHPAKIGLARLQEEEDFRGFLLYSVQGPGNQWLNRTG